MGFDTTTDIGEELKKMNRKQSKPESEKDKKPGDKGKEQEKKFKKYIPYRKYAYPILVALLAFIVFSQTASVPIAGKLAEAYTERTVQSQIASDISRQNPYLPEEETISRAEKEAKEVLNTEAARNRTASETERIRNYYQNPQGITYLYRFDPYLYLRRAGNLIETGTLGEYEEDGKAYETLRYAPLTTGMGKSLGPYFIAGMSYLINPTNPDEEQGAFWLPVLIGVLSVLLIYAMGKYLFDAETGLISSLLFIITRASVSVFHGGSSDTPPLNLFFSILITFLIIYAWKNKSTSKFKAGTSFAGAVLAYYLFSKTWSGSPYILFVLLLWGVTYAFLSLKKRGRTTEMYALLFGGLASAAAIYVFRGSGFVHVALKRLGLVNTESVYPTAFSTISELQPMAFSQFWGDFGGVVLVASLIGSIILSVRQWRNPNEKCILLAWYPLILLPFMSGRFYMYAIPPLALLSGYGIMRTGSWLSKFDFGFTNFWSRIGWTSIVSLVIVSFMIPGTVAELNKYPYVDDAIQEASIDIRIDSPEDSIITTWWDYGYIYQYYANRATTFDGGTFEPERLYWVSRALLEKNESRAAGIIRMLNCGGERGAFKRLNKDNPEEAISTLEKILPLSREEAWEQAPEDVVNHTHCPKTRPGVLVVSSDMLEKIDVFNHFANWDFRYGLSMAEKIDFRRGNCEGNACSYGVVFNETEATIQGRHPKKFIHVSSNFTNKTVLEYEDGVDVTILVVGEYDAFYMQPGFEDTVLVRSLFLDEMENFDVLTMRDMRKRIAAYNVTYP